MSADLKGGGVELTIDSHGVGTIAFDIPQAILARRRARCIGPDH